MELDQNGTILLDVAIQSEAIGSIGNTCAFEMEIGKVLIEENYFTELCCLEQAFGTYYKSFMIVALENLKCKRDLSKSPRKVHYHQGVEE